MNPNHEEFLFQLALSKPAEKRSKWLEAECDGDAMLRQRLDALLAAHEQPATELGETSESTIKDNESIRDLDEAVGQTLGRYKLLQQIGEGGCGVVYVAEQTEPVRRRVALKVIKLGMDTKQVVARFEAERQALAMMDHPNIAKVLDAGTTESAYVVPPSGGSDRLKPGLHTGRPYFVMELVRGIKITDYCDQEKLGTKERLDLFIKVCHAIQHAHQKGIIHRDIKPSNILVTLHDGVPVPKVIDFGIAKATEGRLTDATVYTQLHQFIGTPAYMSPEQAEMSGLDIDTRSDIYSLGVLLYELLTGRTPFDGRELMSMGLDAMRKTIREREPARPSTKLATLQGEDLTTTAKRRSVETSKLASLLRGDLDWIVMKCLEKDRQRRYETANGLAADLNRHLTNEPVVARPPSQFYRVQKMVRRNKTASIATVGIVAALAIGIGLAMAALVQKNAATQRELDQSVRADTVTKFINSLLSDTLPVMLRQGNSQGARELIDTADRLATSSLSNAPAAEIELRYRLAWILSTRINDFQAGRRQGELIHGLLPKLSDNQLTLSRDRLRTTVAVMRLYATDGQSPEMVEEAMRGLDALSVEFMGRTPPEVRFAAVCRFHQGYFSKSMRQIDLAEERLQAAYELIRGNEKGGMIERYAIPAEYAGLLAYRGKLSLAETMARENLQLPLATDEDTRSGYLRMVWALADILCQQERFAEALRMIEEQHRGLADRNITEAEALNLDRFRGRVLARSGNAHEALKVLTQVAASNIATVEDWDCAAGLAIATENHEVYRRLCRSGLLRFATTAQGKTAAALAHGLLMGLGDETMLSLARGLVERLASARDWSNDLASYFESLLATREQRYPEALVLLDKHRSQAGGRYIVINAAGSPAIQACLFMIRSRLCAELDRNDEARRDFSEGRANLNRALGDKPGHDRGEGWLYCYEAEWWQREAEAVFKAKGIPLPKEDTN